MTPTETLPGPDLDSWRNRLAHRIANLALNRIASAEYRNIIGGAIILGMRTAARDATRPNASRKLVSAALGREEAIRLVRGVLETDVSPGDHDGLAVRIVVNLDHALDPGWVPHLDPPDVDGSGSPFGI